MNKGEYNAEPKINRPDTSNQARTAGVLQGGSVPSKSEQDLNLEQLRWLDNKFKIKVGITEFKSQSVDTTEDIEKIVEFHSKNS